MKLSKKRHANRKSLSRAIDPQESALAAGLRYVSDHSGGITRHKKGSKFLFLDKNGVRIKDLATLKRIRSLVIPPAWENVWICPTANGHLQATGRDIKGRKQYRYHPDWREVRDEAKYERVISFAEALPTVRARVEKDIAVPGIGKSKILATVVQLLELSLIRIGNEEYAKTNASFGLTTMRNRHVLVKGSTIKFHFRGKSGKDHTIELSNKRLATVIQKCQDLPGQHLFEYLDENGDPQPVGSEDVNDYLREITGQPFTAKDFRTWAGTILAAIALGKMEEVDSQAAVKSNIVRAIEAVAQMLGNTAAICRKCYIHPAITTSYMEGRLAEALRARADAKLATQLHNLKPEEAAVLTLLRQELEQRSHRPNSGKDEG